MSLSAELRAGTQVAFAFTEVLERALGNDALLTVGTARDAIGDMFGEEPVRGVMMAIEDQSGTEHTIALIALDRFATALEGAASDEMLLTTVGPALDAAAQAIGSIASEEFEAQPSEEAGLPHVSEIIGDADTIVYPILEGTEPIACLVVGVATATGAPASSHVTGTARVDASAPMGAAPLVLADVEMGVTAELGRCTMTVRELLSLTPGAVIDLDRAAGAPVDVLVNGTRIARGEVVVIDEEFGIRISEILKNGSPAN